MLSRRSIVWIAFGVGVSMLLSSCFGGGAVELTTQTEPTPEPIYEPAGSPGLDSFFPLEEQITMFNADLASAVADQPDAEAASEDPTSTITTIGLGGPTEEDIKTGLYGGTAENTCDPERLIQYLLDNPDKGQVWADVQGIKFVEIPDYIRSLRVDVLEVDTLVLNHGFDPKGHAIPIVSTLAAGTAVLVDDNGDVRTRCYCGNPILPYTPVTYMPPKCLTFYAVVYTSPSDREVIDGVPRSVRATNQIATYDNVDWREISWGNSTGWVRADEAQPRYCKPSEKPDCVTTAQVLNRPGSQSVIGEIDRGYISVLAEDVEGWSLIKFADRSGWIQASQMGGQDCTYDVVCVSASSGTWVRPGFRGKQIISDDAVQKIELTGQTYADTSGTYVQAYVTYPAPTRVGYLRTQDITERPVTDCKTSTRCTLFDFDAQVYEESTGTATYGTLWFAEAEILSGPTNNRYEIDWGTARGWVEVGDLLGSDCVKYKQVSCIVLYGSVYEPLPPNSGTRSAPSGPIVVTFTGKIHRDGSDTYREFTSTSVSGGPAWVLASTGYNSLPYANCQVEPPCDSELQVCEPRCVAEQVEDGWRVTGFWMPAQLLTIDFIYPVGLTSSFGGGLHPSGVTDVGTGSLVLNNAIMMQWFDNVRGVGGTVDCEVDICDFQDYDGELGYLASLFEQQDFNPDTCVEIQCSGDFALPLTGGDTTIDVDWSPPLPLDVHVDWPTGISDEDFFAASPIVSSVRQALVSAVQVIWFSDDGQSGTLECEAPCRDDVIRPDGSFICCDEDDSQLGESTRCCKGTDVPTSDGSLCCPEDQVRAGGDCCVEFDGINLVVKSECEGCDGITLPSGECCSEALILNPEVCCPASDPPNREAGICGTGCDGEVAPNGDCCVNSRVPVQTGCCVESQVNDADECCPDGQQPLGDSCGPICREGQQLNGAVCECPTGTIDNGSSCVEPPPDCRSDQVRANNGQCVCPSGTRDNGSTCEPTCPEGQVLRNGECESICGLGQVPDGTGGCDPVCDDGTVDTGQGCGPTCPNGANENGDCLRLCAPGDLNLDGLCTCADGFQIDPNARVNGCVIVCPAGQINLSATECGALEVQCPAGTINVDGTCQAEEVGCPGGQVDLGDGCVCGRGTTLNDAGQCVGVDDTVQAPALNCDPTGVGYNAAPYQLQENQCSVFVPAGSDCPANALGRTPQRTVLASGEVLCTI